jgi:hypothetical protein
MWNMGNKLSELNTWKKIVLAAAFVFVSCAGWAASPEDALSARPDGAVYISARADNLGGMLRNIFSPENVERITSLVPPQDAGGIQMLANVVAQLPVKSAALAAGTTADDVPFLQIAASMPPELRPSLDRVAEGKAQPADLAMLMLGEGAQAQLLAAAINPVLQKGSAAGPYYTLEGDIALSARDDLLLVALSPKDLQDSLEALGDAKKRLAPKRRFDDPSYYFLHVDMPTVVALAGEDDEFDEKERQELKVLMDVFQRPLEMETAFRFGPENFLISSAANIFESLPWTERFRDLPLQPGADMFLAGEGKLFCGISSVTSFSAEYTKAFPFLAKIWERFAREASKRGVTEKDIENLLTGSMSLVSGGSATVMGVPVPGVCLALRGQKGAAALILNAILADPDFTNAIPVSPLKVAGWDTLVRVDPSLLPVPLLLGVKDETFFLGMIDPKGLDKKPTFSPKAAKLLEEDLFAGGFFDVAAIWEYLRKEAANPESHLRRLTAELAPPVADILLDILNAEPGVSFVGFRAPSADTSFVDFSLVDVPVEKRLLFRLAAAAQALEAVRSDDLDGSPLALLQAARNAVEEEIAQNPDAALDEWAEAFGDDVTFIKTDSGDIYIGTRVAGDAQKLELIESAEKFSLTGSAGLSIVPDGSPYDGQEAVWIKVKNTGSAD